MPIGPKEHCAQLVWHQRLPGLQGLILQLRLKCHTRCLPCKAVRVWGFHCLEVPQQHALWHLLARQPACVACGGNLLHIRAS